MQFGALSHGTGVGDHTDGVVCNHKGIALGVARIVARNAAGPGFGPGLGVSGGVGAAVLGVVGPGERLRGEVIGSAGAVGRPRPGSEVNEDGVAGFMAAGVGRASA